MARMRKGRRTLACTGRLAPPVSPKAVRRIDPDGVELI